MSEVSPILSAVTPGRLTVDNWERVQKYTESYSAPRIEVHKHC